MHVAMYISIYIYMDAQLEKLLYESNMLYITSNFYLKSNLKVTYYFFLKSNFIILLDVQK